MPLLSLKKGVRTSIRYLHHVALQGLQLTLLSSQATKKTTEGSLDLYVLVLDVLDAEHAAMHSIVVGVL